MKTVTRERVLNAPDSENGMSINKYYSNELSFSLEVAACTPIALNVDKCWECAHAHTSRVIRLISMINLSLALCIHDMSS